MAPMAASRAGSSLAHARMPLAARRPATSSEPPRAAQRRRQRHVVACGGLKVERILAEVGLPAVHAEVRVPAKQKARGRWCQLQGARAALAAYHDSNDLLLGGAGMAGVPRGAAAREGAAEVALRHPGVAGCATCHPCSSRTCARLARAHEPNPDRGGESGARRAGWLLTPRGVWPAGCATWQASAAISCSPTWRR